jgi:cell division protein FtsI (penicillin-binding protein 3)
VTAARLVGAGIPPAARTRARIAIAIISVALCGLGYRAYGLQVDDYSHYADLATRQHGLAVDIPAPRGTILDARDRPLAISADSDSIWADPREIRDVAATAERLAAILGGDPAVLEAKLGAERRFVWIDRHVDPQVAAAVRAAKLAGIEIAREPRRWYPAGALGGPVLGHTNVDGVGIDGLELAHNAALTGTRGGGRGLRDARGRRVFADGLALAEVGATVKLTIDRSIQAIADAALASAVTTNGASSGVVVVLDVATSHVLAMSSYPSFDPNLPMPVGGARNRAVTDAYEAGSGMKLFTIAAALDAGVVTPETEFDLNNGSMQIGSHTINDVDHDKYLTVSGILKRSSNVGAVQIGQRLGRERLREALVRFGFGAKTRIELPGEQAGTLHPAQRWREVELATITYGYGLTVTPLQLAAAVAAIGNDGVYRAPRVLADHEGEPTRVLTAKSARAVKAMMATVFERGKNHGTAWSVVVPGYRCGGKTGTARKYDPELKQYVAKRYLSSFVGLAPIDDPRLAIVVLIDEPTGVDYFGGKVAGPVFARVASETLRYLGVPGETLVCPPPVPGAPPNTRPKTCVTDEPRAP